MSRMLMVLTVAGVLLGAAPRAHAEEVTKPVAATSPSGEQTCAAPTPTSRAARYHYLPIGPKGAYIKLPY